MLLLLLLGMVTCSALETTNLSSTTHVLGVTCRNLSCSSVQHVHETQSTFMHVCAEHWSVRVLACAHELQTGACCWCFELLTAASWCFCLFFELLLLRMAKVMLYWASLPGLGTVLGSHYAGLHEQDHDFSRGAHLGEHFLLRDAAADRLPHVAW